MNVFLVFMFLLLTLICDIKRVRPAKTMATSSNSQLWSVYQYATFLLFPAIQKYHLILFNIRVSFDQQCKYAIVTQHLDCDYHG